MIHGPLSQGFGLQGPALQMRCRDATGPRRLFHTRVQALSDHSAHALSLQPTDLLRWTCLTRGVSVLTDPEGTCLILPQGCRDTAGPGTVSGAASKQYLLFVKQMLSSEPELALSLVRSQADRGHRPALPCVLGHLPSVVAGAPSSASW